MGMTGKERYVAVVLGHTSRVARRVWKGTVARKKSDPNEHQRSLSFSLPPVTFYSIEV